MIRFVLLLMYGYVAFTIGRVAGVGYFLSLLKERNPNLFQRVCTHMKESTS